ncbi:hypothetical protein I79_003845 [Cricetulus griseus]|uniref:Uncharacterized protein n=1 Tax=Cricetulus griseus TaxID=10029 RepID=G3H124_CRIGR|nr:hypothetical protein I79_003845 [Cricetulus griseus]
MGQTSLLSILRVLILLLDLFSCPQYSFAPKLFLSSCALGSLDAASAPLHQEEIQVQERMTGDKYRRG